MRHLPTVLAMAAMLWVPAASAERFRTGDLIIAFTVGDGFDVPATGKICEFSPDGLLVQEFYAGGVLAFDLKFSPSGILHAAGGSQILRFASDGTPLTPLHGPSGDFMFSLAFDRNGRLFATTLYGRVVRFGADGTLLGGTSLSGVLDTKWADLGADQCTLYHLRNPLPQIGRFDVCTNTSSAPLATTLGDSGRTLLVLADGTLLVSGYAGEMYRVRQDGTVLRHYATHANAYARDSSPNFVWVNTGAKVAKFDLENDVFATVPFDAGVGVVSGITVVGADVPTIPALSPLVLTLAGLILAVSAVARLHMSGS